MKTKFEIESLVRKNILELKPYSSARDEFKGEASIFLDANENAHGSPIENNFNRYPDPLQLRLKTELAQLKNTSIQNIFVGNGSDEAIDLLFRIFCEPGKDNVMVCPPTYGMYEVSANINDIQLKKVNLTPEFQLDVKGIFDSKDSNTKMIFICSPNNPSGNLMNRNDVIQVLEKFNGIVVVDEAYIDFAYESLVNLIEDYPNLVILQTLSKAYGMAGLRIGMAFSNKTIIDLMNKVKAPYNLNEYSIKQGIEAVKNKVIVDKWILEIKNEKRKMINALGELDFVLKINPSQANFLLVKFNDAKTIYHYLLSKGIVVRDRSLQVNCENCLRITIGTNEENTKLLNALKELS